MEKNTDKIAVEARFLDALRHQYDLCEADKKAVEDLCVRLDVAKNNKKPFDIAIADLPDGAWLSLVRHNYVVGEIAEGLKKRISAITASDSVSKFGDFAAYFTRKCDQKGYQFDILFNGRWYPISLTANIYKGAIDEKVFISGPVSFGGKQGFEFAWRISSSLFSSGSPIKISAILDRNGGYPLRETQTDKPDYMALIQKAVSMSHLHGKQVMVSGALTWVEVFFMPYLEIAYQETGKSRRTIIEGELELNRPSDGESRDREEEEGGIEWPFVRVFSFDFKRYVFADLRDLSDYEYDEHAVENLVLPDEMADIVKRVFCAKNDTMFGDSTRGRHGGMVILGSGGPGVGKTMSAETYAEFTKRPLYSMETGEMGIDVDKIEDRLSLIFRRAARWNAVLLFDEADIFMEKRNNDLERSAIVGVFLRLLDYFPGMLFLTTNRADSMDDAFKSRVTLHLKYPPLLPEARKKIWAIMLKAAKVEVDGSADKYTDVEINGRQIRNVVRLAKIAHGDKMLAETMFGLTKYCAK